jgi:hypothetical protein
MKKEFICYQFCVYSILIIILDLQMVLFKGNRRNVPAFTYTGKSIRLFDESRFRCRV